MIQWIIANHIKCCAVKLRKYLLPPTTTSPFPSPNPVSLRSNFKWVLSHANIHWFEWDFARVKTEQRLWDVIFRGKPSSFFYGNRESLYRKVIVLLLHKSSGRRASTWDGNTCNQSARDWQAPLAETPELGGRQGFWVSSRLLSYPPSTITLKYPQDLSVEPQAKGAKVERAKF